MFERQNVLADEAAGESGPALAESRQEQRSGQFRGGHAPERVVDPRVGGASGLVVDRLEQPLQELAKRVEVRGVADAVEDRRPQVGEASPASRPRRAARRSRVL
jgi:hypothetical protein